MRMVRLFVLVVASLVAVAALSANASASPGRNAPCFPRGTTTVAGSGAVRVYLSRQGRSRVPRRNVVVCNFARGRRYVLGPAQPLGHHAWVPRVQPGGRFVVFVRAHEAGSSAGPFTPDRLVVLDTRNGVRSEPAVGCASDPNGADADGLKVTDLAVTGRGTAMWICLRGEGGSWYGEVRTAGPKGAMLLDSDAATPTDPIDPTFLALAPTSASGGSVRAFWQRRSGPRTSLLA